MISRLWHSSNRFFCVAAWLRKEINAIIESLITRNDILYINAINVMLNALVKIVCCCIKRLNMMVFDILAVTVNIRQQINKV